MLTPGAILDSSVGTVERERPRALIVYLAPGRAVRAVASAFLEHLAEATSVELAEIRATHSRPFPVWLLLSYLPGLGVEITPTVTDVSAYDFVVLGTPKWSLNCPPVTGYLQRLRGAKGKRFVLYVTSKGFGGERYARGLARPIHRKGGEVLDVLHLRSGDLQSGAYHDVVRECVRSVLRLELLPLVTTRCRHRFAYYGVVNLFRRNALLGNVDVWRCQLCHALDAAARGPASPEQDTLGFHPNEDPHAQWTVFVCTAQEPPIWGVRPVTNPTDILHYCGQEGSLGGGGPLAPTMLPDDAHHWLWPLSDVVNRSVELT